MWERWEDKLALLELLTQPALRRRASQHLAFDWLCELAWTRASSRRDEVTLVAERRADLVALLDRVWPSWRADHLALLEAGLPPTPTGRARLLDRRRAHALPDLPDRINRRTAAAATAPDAKSALTEARRAALGDLELVDDGLLRIRPPEGLVAHRGGRALPLDAVVGVFGELGISDRAMRDGLTLEGAVEAIVTVENLGAWSDMPAPAGWMLVHVPGWNTASVRRLHTLFAHVPAVHFGDLDPNGLLIFRHLRAHLPTLTWLVPPFWRELLPLHGLACAWPPDLDLTDTPPLVRDLAAAGRWLEQERLVLDPRFEAALRDAIAEVRQPR